MFKKCMISYFSYLAFTTHWNQLFVVCLCAHNKKPINSFIFLHFYVHFIELFVYHSTTFKLRRNFYIKDVQCISNYSVSPNIHNNSPFPCHLGWCNWTTPSSIQERFVEDCRYCALSSGIHFYNILSLSDFPPGCLVNTVLQLY